MTVGLSLVYGRQQYFRVQPLDVEVQEGGEAMLECEVANLAGQVQWATEEFVLGRNFYFVEDIISIITSRCKMSRILHNKNSSHTQKKSLSLNVFKF